MSITPSPSIHDDDTAAAISVVKPGDNSKKGPRNASITGAQHLIHTHTPSTPPLSIQHNADCFDARIVLSFKHEYDVFRTVA